MGECNTENVDALVLGGNMRGLVAAHVLDRLGYRAVLIERAPWLGGADGSFTTKGGTRFELGLHVLDYMRSELATRLLTQAVDGAVHRVTLQRAIALRGQIMPYAPRPQDMPEPIRALLPSDDLVDDLGDQHPTRERLAQYYGSDFTDLIFDEVLPSFPAENRHRAFGVDEARLLANIYPWFFPRARRTTPSADESRAFHDQLRAGVPQDILYPQQGGFGAFAQGLAGKLTNVEVITGAGDVHTEVEPGTHTIRAVETGGRRFEAPRYFWAGPWPTLCDLIDLPCQDVATDRVMIGSFVLDRPVDSEFHEILVGDPELPVNRIYFPARFREANDPLMQVEFAVPRAEDWPDDADYWQHAWRHAAEKLGLLDAQHEVVEFDYKSAPMHFNAYGMEGEALRDADATALHEGSNIFPVIPSMSNLNLNRYVPRAVAYTAAVLAEDA